MKLDRDLQREILRELKGVYPGALSFQRHADFASQNFQGNMFYLQAHGLIESLGPTDPGNPRMLQAFITAKGLEFLEEDGGLGAILGAVTVKVDVNNVRFLPDDKLPASSLPQEQKGTLLMKLKRFLRRA